MHLVHLPVQIIEALGDASPDPRELYLIAQATGRSVLRDQTLDIPRIHELDDCVHLGVIVKGIMHLHQPAGWAEARAAHAHGWANDRTCTRTEA